MTERHITIEDLRKYRALNEEIRSIETEINSLYSPYSSPMGNPSTGAPFNSTPGDPTAQSVYRILEKKQSLEEKKEELLELSYLIDRFVLHIEDHHVAAIIRYHYIVGLSWAKTAKMMNDGMNSSDNLRMVVKRYFSQI